MITQANPQEQQNGSKINSIIFENEEEMKSNSKYEKTLVWKSLKDLFPLNRSLTGPDNYKTLSYVKKEFVPGLKINKVKSGSKVFDWKVPSEWKVKKAYI